MSDRPEPQAGTICAYDLEIIGDGKWQIGYMHQPASEHEPEDHLAFASRLDTGEMFTMERRQLEGYEDPYICQPHNARSKMPEQVANVLEVIADTAHAVAEGKGEEMQITSMQGSKAWSIGLTADGSQAYAQALDDGSRATLARPLANDGYYLQDPDISGEVPEQAHNLMYVVASTASYMQLAERITEQTQGFAAKESERRQTGPEEGQAR